MQLLRPRALRPGDRIGIVSTSSPVSAGELDRLTAYLGGRGYPVRVADGVLDRAGYLAGRARRRAEGVMRMFSDPEVSLIMPAHRWHRCRRIWWTCWMPSTSGAILLLESVSTTFEQVDRMLTRLYLAGVFDEIKALIIGAPADWLPEDAPDASSDALVLRCAKGRFPVITGVPFGHQQTKIQFPIGCRVEFDLRGEHPVLRYLEDLVALDH